MTKALSIGSFLVDQQGVILAAQGPLCWQEDGSALQLKGKKFSSLFRLEDGSALTLESVLSEDSPHGITCHLPNHEIVYLFVSRLDPLQENIYLTVIFLNETILEREAAAHVRLREIVGSVIAGFAHEVRNPLAAISALSEDILSKPDLDEEILRSLSKIPSLIYRIEELLRLALSYGRPKPPKTSWHQLDVLLENALDVLCLQGFSVTSWALQFPEYRVPVCVDAGHASSILTNLLTNAAQAAVNPKKLKINILLREKQTDIEPPPKGFVAVDITDDGSGVPLSAQSQLFEPFFTTKAEGTGLGLALARDLARMNGGDVLLLKTSPSGSTFRILLSTK